jgi:BirA family transcriptional regulator, biotin operon repressor / biotin---[acetyl-CoA-carboxylase] ligase
MPECHSTNDEASRLIQAGNVMEGTTIVAQHQTAGRGQRGNTWISERGKNLTFSIVLKPVALPAKDQFYLNMAIALGVYDYLQENFKDPIKIKWPNDILIKGKKVCGILIENQVSGQQIQHSIVGVGLNVNQEKFSLENATSLRVLSGKEFQLEDVLECVLEKIESRYLLVREQLLDSISIAFTEVMYWLGEQHVFSTHGVEFTGMITGIDEIGRLKIQTSEGLRTFGVKEVEFLR